MASREERKRQGVIRSLASSAVNVVRDGLFGEPTITCSCGEIVPLKDTGNCGNHLPVKEGVFRLNIILVEAPPPEDEREPIKPFRSRRSRQETEPEPEEPPTLADLIRRYDKDALLGKPKRRTADDLSTWEGMSSSELNAAIDRANGYDLDDEDRLDDTPTVPHYSLY